MMSDLHFRVLIAKFYEKYLIYFKNDLDLLLKSSITPSALLIAALKQKQVSLY